MHQQIVRAREGVLGSLSGEFIEIQQTLLKAGVKETETLQALSHRTDVLLQLRQQIMAGPSWPFRNAGSVWRATIATASPVILFVVNRVVQTYIFPPLGLK